MEEKLLKFLLEVIERKNQLVEVQAPSAVSGVAEGDLFLEMWYERSQMIGRALHLDSANAALAEKKAKEKLKKRKLKLRLKKLKRKASQGTMLDACGFALFPTVWQEILKFAIHRKFNLEQ